MCTGSAHYGTAGGVMRAAPKIIPIEERFWRRIMPEPNSGCWLWLGHLNNEGYGQFVVGSKLDGSRRFYLAHRMAHMLYVGEIPSYLELDHLCRVRSCVNPDHLEAVSRSVNVRRGISAQRRRERAAAQTHCKRGHEFTTENTVQAFKDRPGRGCRMCKNLIRRVGFRAEKV